MDLCSISATVVSHAQLASSCHLDAKCHELGRAGGYVAGSSKLMATECGSEDEKSSVNRGQGQGGIGREVKGEDTED